MAKKDQDTQDQGRKNRNIKEELQEIKKDKRRSNIEDNEMDNQFDDGARGSVKP